MSCTRCNGTGYLLVRPAIEVEEGIWEPERWKTCTCTYLEVFKSRFGPEIAGARKVNSSPLYVPTGPGEFEVNRTLCNVHIKGRWSDLVSHLKYALLWEFMARATNYYCPIVTDEQLLQVYLGKKAYDKRRRDKRETVESYNSLSDLIGPDQNLAIIRLGMMGHKNRAVPGIIKEAILIRQAANCPTWVVETPDEPFGPDHLSYSEDLATYLEVHFETVVIPHYAAAITPIEQEEGISVDEPEEDISEASEEVETETVPEEVESDDQVLAKVLGGSKTKSKPPKKSWRRR